MEAMPFFRLVFANNIIMSCELDDRIQLKGTDVYYEQDKGKLIFAHIRADTFIDAVKKATEIVEEVTKSSF